MLGVVRVRMGLEPPCDLRRGCARLGIQSHGVGPRIDLCRRVADHGVQPRVDKFGVILVEHLAVDDRRVLDLLREARLQEEELRREDGLEH